MQNMQNMKNMQNIDMQKSKISESESSINSRTCLGHLVLFDKVFGIHDSDYLHILDDSHGPVAYKKPERLRVLSIKDLVNGKTKIITVIKEKGVNQIVVGEL